jgi:hypothetical protein
MNVTPAAISALYNDDMANFMIAMTPGGIEAQEARGQQVLVNSDVLPLDIGRNTTWEQLATLGIVRGEQVDDLFVKVALPVGWHKKPTEHSMWSDLIDEQGRVRARIFYKAAFYDRSAHFNLTARYSYGIHPVVENDWDGPRYGAVTDQGNVIWHTDRQLVRNINTKTDKLYYDIYDELEKAARVWLEEHYPDYRNPFAYW